MNQHEGQVAVRAYAVPKDYKKPRRRRRSQLPWPDLALIFECSTASDECARLTCGSYLVLNGSRLVDRGFFYADDLPPKTLIQLQDYCAGREQDLGHGEERFRLLTRTQFIREVFLKVGYKARGVIAGFILPNQISLLAVNWSEARAGIYKGGFSFTLLNYIDQTGTLRPHAHAPRVAVKSIDGRRALMGFTSAWRQDQKPKGERKDKDQAPFRGHFVDCRTLAFALSGKSFDLASACDYYGLKSDIQPWDLNASDPISEFRNLENKTAAIALLYQQLLKDYSQHPISLPPDQAYSGASLGKAYLREMGIKTPPLRVSKKLKMSPQEVMGAAMVSYYGGRAECRIRKQVLPVTYLDFLSMYPTVHTLMGLWPFLIAQSIKTGDWTQEATEFLEEVNPEDLFTPSTWESLAVLVKVLPEDDVLPIRTKYSQQAHGAYTLAVNEISSRIPLWYTLADCIASKLLTGKTPTVVQAIRFSPKGVQKSLKPVRILGRREVDPTKDDFFKALVELRHRLKGDPTIEPGWWKRLNDCLKTIVNASGYGIFIELNPQEGKKAAVEVYGLEHFSCKVESFEEPGEFFLAMVGTFLTAGARLMLALLEPEITHRGGSYVFMDTDSAAVVASKHGGMYFCPGGMEQAPNGTAAVKALSWDEVDEILAEFDRLNPYDRKYVASGILKLEDENHADGSSGTERIELQCLSISTKRYVLFYEDETGIHIRKASEHGLGNYLPPVDPATGVKVDNWIESAWKKILQTERKRTFTDDPSWFDSFVRTQVQLSTPGMMKWIEPLNDRIEVHLKGRKNKYPARIKPFSSIDHIPVSAITFRRAKRDQQVCLVSLSNDLPPSARSWVNIRDQDDELYSIAPPRRNYLPTNSLPGLTYQELIGRHGLLPESKFLSFSGEPCGRTTRGILMRRKQWVLDVLHIGKEANNLDQVQAGLVDSQDQVLLTYERDPWENLQPIVAEMPVSLIMETTGYSRSMSYALRKGERRPSGELLKRLVTLVRNKRHLRK